MYNVTVDLKPSCLLSRGPQDVGESAWRVVSLRDGRNIPFISEEGALRITVDVVEMCECLEITRCAGGQTSV
jgi:hypothetical protein